MPAPGGMQVCNVHQPLMGFSFGRMARARYTESAESPWNSTSIWGPLTVDLRILYNNEAMAGFEPDWGFACLIDGRERVLFDTGAKPDVLERNMEAAEVDPASIDKVVISHDHWDHADGLPYVCANNEKATVYMLPSFRADLKEMIQPPLTLVEVTEPGEISPGLLTTGPVEGPKDEQAVFFHTADGLVLITGCAHPGVDALMERAAAYGKIHAVLGGFHGFDDLDALEGIAFLGACHCTQHMAAMAERYPESFREIAAGMQLSF